MADYQQVVDDIRFLLQSEDCELSDQLHNAAEQYVAACRDINLRLKRCRDFLRQGLRSEAIQLAETQPALLDALALLDFPERPEWEDIVTIYQLPRPEPLLLDIAEELNDAYVVEQPLKKLLARHRLLALARAPLKQRIAILRRLAEFDTESPYWEEDLREFEAARHRELEAEIRAAASNRDDPQLRELAAELADLNWRLAPPAELVRTVRQQLALLERAAARDELLELESQLNAAFNELDAPLARRLRERWNEIAQRARLPQDDPLPLRVEPIFGWIDDEDAREASDRDHQFAVAALESALNRDTPRLKLERLANDVLRFQQGMPETLAHRYHQRLADIDLAETRTRRLYIGSALVVLLLLAGFVGLLVHRQTRENEVARLAGLVQDRLEAGELQAARQLLSKFDGWEFQPSLAELERALAGAERAEQNRLDQLQLKTTEIRSILASAQQPDDFAAAFDALEETRELARLVDEKLALADLEKDARRRLDEQFKLQLAQFEQDFGGASAELKRIRDLPADDQLAPEIELQLADLRKQIPSLDLAAKTIAAFRNVASQKGADLSANVRLLERELGDVETNRKESQQKRQILAQLTTQAALDPQGEAALKPLEALAAVYTSYAEAFPGDPLARDFAQVASECSVWKAAAVWNSLGGAWRNPVPATEDMLKRRLADCQAFLDEHPASPDRRVAQEYLEYLQAMQRRTQDESGDSSEGCIAQLRDLFGSPLIAETSIIHDNTGKRYYLLEPVDFTGKSTATLKYVVGFREETRVRGLPTNELAELKSVASPQALLAKSVRQKLNELPLAGWTPLIRELSEHILKDRQMDPFLRFYLLKECLEIGAAGSVPLQAALQRHQKLLDDAEIDPFVRWMDPEDDDAAKAREKARDLLNRYPSLNDAWTQAAAHEAALGEKLGLHVGMVGWAAQESGRWTLKTRWHPKVEYELRVAFPNDDCTRSEWRVIGRANSQTVTVEPSANPFLRHGRPVFATPIAPATAAVSARVPTDLRTLP